MRIAATRRRCFPRTQVIQGAIDSFTPEGVVLTNGTQLHSDLVIYGTGFAKCLGRNEWCGVAPGEAQRGLGAGEGGICFSESLPL